MLNHKTHKNLNTLSILNTLNTLNFSPTIQQPTYGVELGRRGEVEFLCALCPSAHLCVQSSPPNFLCASPPLRASLRPILSTMAFLSISCYNPLRYPQKGFPFLIISCFENSKLTRLTLVGFFVATHWLILMGRVRPWADNRMITLLGNPNTRKGNSTVEPVKTQAASGASRTPTISRTK